MSAPGKPTQSAFNEDDPIVPNPQIKPRDAATLILIRRDEGAPRVLMGRRHGKMAFMANKYVFPGGRLDQGDWRLKLYSDFKPHVLKRASHGISEMRARGLALAAIRETFEETGVLIGERAEKLPRTKTKAWQDFFAHGIAPRLDVLEMIARAITPPGRPRRFDARFFMTDASAIAHQLDRIENEELLEAAWPTLDEARKLDLPAITRRVLDEVEARLSDGADPMRPAPFYRFLRGKSVLDYI
jgi:8-oxo-dGTP pyrophosphatase MutT (NUDIX family)